MTIKLYTKVATLAAAASFFVVLTLCSAQLSRPDPGDHDSRLSRRNLGDNGQVFQNYVRQGERDILGQPLETSSQDALDNEGSRVSLQRKRRSPATFNHDRSTGGSRRSRRTASVLFVAATLIAAATLLLWRLGSVIWKCLVPTGAANKTGSTPRSLAGSGEEDNKECVELGLLTGSPSQNGRGDTQRRRQRRMLDRESFIPFVILIGFLMVGLALLSISLKWSGKSSDSSPKYTFSFDTSHANGTVTDRGSRNSTGGAAINGTSEKTPSVFPPTSGIGSSQSESSHSSVQNGTTNAGVTGSSSPVFSNNRTTERPSNDTGAGSASPDTVAPSSLPSTANKPVTHSGTTTPSGVSTGSNGTALHNATTASPKTGSTVTSAGDFGTTLNASEKTNATTSVTTTPTSISAADLDSVSTNTSGTLTPESVTTTSETTTTAVVPATNGTTAVTPINVTTASPQGTRDSERTTSARPTTPGKLPWWKRNAPPLQVAPFVLGFLLFFAYWFEKYRVLRKQ